MINAGDKFVIEIEAVYGRADGGNAGSVPTLYRAKGFRSLVFDEEGLEKLVPLDQMRPSWWEEIYQRGLDEAWEAARVIFGYCHADINKAIFDGKAHCGLSADRMARNALDTLSPSEAIAKIREYKERKKAEGEAIKVGDEVTWASDPTHFVVVALVEGKGASVLASGKSHWVNKADLRKTGRHFPQIAEVLVQIRNPDGKEGT